MDDVRCSGDGAIGDAKCLFGKALLDKIKNDPLGNGANHSFSTVDKDLSTLFSSLKIDHDSVYTQLLWDAVRLAKATQLQPRAAIEKLEVLYPESKVTCDEVTKYKLGVESKRSRFAMEPVRFESVNEPVYTVSGSDSIKLVQGTEVVELPESGGVIKFLSGQKRCDEADSSRVAACALEAIHIDTAYGYARVRVTQPLASVSEKIFASHLITRGRAQLLSAAEMETLKTPAFKNAAVYLDLCLKSASCGDESSTNWVNMGSWRLGFRNTCAPGLEGYEGHCAPARFKSIPFQSAYSRDVLGGSQFITEVDEKLYVGTPNGLAVSRDGGLNWAPVVKPGLPARRVQALHSEGSNIYV
ncbi:MAG: hypothetical protein EOP09_17495, partial [Proteobacteria bacterium]